MDQEPWFQPKRSGLGLTPINWQGVCVIVVIVVVIFATVAIVVSVIHNPPTAIITILVSTGAELAIFIPFTYRHARRTRQ
jgi:hypothetical protein